MSDASQTAGLISVLVGLMLLILAVPVATLLVQVLAACLPSAGQPLPRATHRPRLALLIPAHNEAVGLAATLQTALAQLEAGDRLLVVADNCTDRTAEVARSAGVEVSERHHATERGKGYALDHGLNALLASGQPPEVLIMIDADCQLAPDAIDLLARTCMALKLPVQADYAMQLPVDFEQSGLRQRIAGFAWAVKNSLRPRGSARLGAPCLLTGTGMAFPWESLAGVSLASGHIVEDMKLGLDLAAIGRAPRYLAQARVWSYFAPEDASRGNQRTRWEHGHLSTLIHELPTLLRAAWQRRDVGLIYLAADLAVPPLALLVMALSSVTAAAGVLAWVAPSVSLTGTVAFLGMIELTLLGLGVLIAWHKVGRSWLAGHELLAAPLYALRKIPIYLQFVIKRQSNWVRARRDGE
ncbi:glycosyltransferase [Piscinibacter sp. SJAQ100]|uniref:Glycosyltransferase n=1 Tax=Aquariibacter albus TaxID=2759899 RepID=A0A839HMB2_9BURK|nr:glycosyltransferase [Aquariibacter albus]